MTLLYLMFMTPEMIILFVLFNILLLVIIGVVYIAFDYKNAMCSFIISKTKWVSRFFKTIYYSNILPQYKIHLVDGFYYPMFKVNSVFYPNKGVDGKVYTWVHYMNENDIPIRYTDLVTAKYYIDTHKPPKKQKPRTYYMW